MDLYIIIQIKQKIWALCFCIKCTCDIIVRAQTVFFSVAMPSNDDNFGYHQTMVAMFRYSDLFS